jgi:tRNA pseudouridine38-40 synthase
MATTCAGRTDAGVHALEQVVHFDTDLDRAPQLGARHERLPARFDPCAGPSCTRWRPSRGQEFHARYSARSRTYHYVLYNHPCRSALLAGPRRLGVPPARRRAHARSGAPPDRHCTIFPAPSAPQLPGENAGQAHARNRHRAARRHDRVHRARQRLPAPHGAQPGRLADLRGPGPPGAGWMAEVLAARDRDAAAPTFMPDGLYLAKIDYDPKWGCRWRRHAAPLPCLLRFQSCTAPASRSAASPAKKTCAPPSPRRRRARLRVLSEEPALRHAAALRRAGAALPPFVSAVALFVNASVDEVGRCRVAPVALLQFHGDETAPSAPPSPPRANAPSCAPTGETGHERPPIC